MRDKILIAIAFVVLFIQIPVVNAGLVSKSYEFKPGTTLEIGASTDDGLRVDLVRFVMPSSTAVRTASEAGVEVAISNTSEKSQRVGVAVALFDAQGRMVGVASGGTKFMPIKPGRQKSYKLVFDSVYVESPRATTFQISVESKP
jgi:hypothetical protein